MQITSTAKIQVQVAPEQRELLDVTMDTYRSACNFVANYIFQTHDLKQFSLNKAYTMVFVNAMDLNLRWHNLFSRRLLQNTKPF